MSIALSLGAILIGLAADRLRRRGVGPEVLLGLVATVFITAQLALILRWPLPSYFLRAVVAAVGAAIVLSYAILAEYFPKELAGRQRGAESVPHRCSVRCAIRDRRRASALDASSGALSRNRVSDSLCFQSRPPDRGVGLVRASASPNALAAANAHAISAVAIRPRWPVEAYPPMRPHALISMMVRSTTSSSHRPDKLMQDRLLLATHARTIHLGSNSVRTMLYRRVRFTPNKPTSSVPPTPEVSRHQA